MDVIVNGEYCDVRLGLVKSLEQTAVEFTLPTEDVWIDVDEKTKQEINSILAEDELVLFVIDSENNVVLDAESPEVILL